MAFNLADALKGVPYQGTGREQIEYIRLDKIQEDPNNFYQLTGLAELADNISLCGLQQPIRVRELAEKPGSFVIVSGHRRRAALEMLVADGYDQWQEAPCIVERDVVSPALQQLRLIYANASTRKMSPAETATQAEQVTDLLYKLKEEGYEFPGRMRDHVAEAMSISKSKLARLKVIRENLDPCWADEWKNGTLTESQAYALAQMPGFWQSIIKEKWGYAIVSLTADQITTFRNRFNMVQKIPCNYGLSLCEHTVTMMEKNVCSDFYAPCNGCCFICDNLRTCKNCCPEARDKKKELKTVEKQAKADAAAEQAERERPGTEFARLVWERIGKARQRSGCTVEALCKARGDSYYSKSFDDDKQTRMESGEGDYGPYSTVSFGHSIHAQDLMRVASVADALACSIDFLLGRTDRMELVPEMNTEPQPEAVSYPGTGWRTGEPENLGRYLLAIKPSDCPMQYEKWSWDGIGWKDFTGYLDPEIDGELIAWTTLPEEED